MGVRFVSQRLECGGPICATMAPMSKKKSQGKKHKFKYAEPTVMASEGVPAEKSAHKPENTRTGQLRVAPAGSVAMAHRDFGYVLRDLRQITVIAVGLVALELVLWYLASSTTLDDMVYRLIKV